MLSKRILVSIFLVIGLTLLVGCFPAPTPPNEVPIITSDPITTATVGVLYTYNVNATDPDGDTLTYSLAVKPTGMTIKSKTGVINWRPTSTQIGNNSVIVKVSDGFLSIPQSFTIKVSAFPPANQKPVITSSPNLTATVGVTYFYDVEATDPNGDVLTYSLTTYPSGMTISSANGLIMWNPISKGNYAVVVKVSDGILYDTQGFTIKVSKPTVLPYTITSSAGTGGTISPLGDVIVNEGADRMFTITPNALYGIEKVLVDGSSVGAVSTYTFIDVAKDHTIRATFTAVEPEPETYTITASADLYGSISPSGDVIVNKGVDKLFTITPDSVFYGIEEVWVDEISQGTVDSYIFVNVTEDHTISATFTFLGYVYNQDQKTHYLTIQLANAVAKVGDTILVMAGIYEEDVTIIVDNLIFKSVEKHGAEIRGRVWIVANNVTIEDFYVNLDTAIDKPPIDLGECEGVTIIGNKIKGGPDSAGINSWTGPVVAHALILIENNEIINGCIGLYLWYESALVTIRNNTMTTPLHEGIWIIQNSKAFLIIENNTVVDAGLEDVKIGWETLTDDRPISINGVTDETTMAQAIFDDNPGINSIFFPWMDDEICIR